MQYRAYAGGKEIRDFYIGGKQVNEIWGGNTLLWNRERVTFRYAVRFILNREFTVNLNGTYTIDEIGYSCMSLGDKPSGKIAYCVMEYGNEPRIKYGVAVGCKTQKENARITIGPYNAYHERGMPYGPWYLDPLKKDSDGIYSWGGNYTVMDVSSIHNSVFIGKSDVKEIKTTDGARLFYDLDEMKAWLLK